jgi:NADH:ubiquinone oxidoreductase subunit 5 (subunit L)/multisubunit Na+/H+ antiporter MnhA subunit
MTPTTLLWTILLPAFSALAVLAIPKTVKYVREALALVSASVSLYLAFALFAVKDLSWSVPWVGSIKLELRLFQFPAFILLGLSGFLFLITLYSVAKMKDHPRVNEYYAYIFLSAAMAFGAVLSDNFVPLIFFWEGLLVTLYALISLGGKEAHRTATKALIIGGFCDFAMILGIGIIWSLSGTMTISEIGLKPEGPAALAFIMMMIGAVGKAGAMPFHTWIPDAAVDAPVTFMAFMPAAFEKLLGIYLLARICLDIFHLEPGSGLAILLMIVGAATIVLAVMMALVQKDLKRLLSYHAVSQVGYMILGIGTAIPIGIAGGIFHMINHAMYKSGLFLSAGSVEHRAGTTDLRKLGGLAREMPITAIGFTVCALAISGVWPLNGFVSKEMVFHGAVESGQIIFAIAAWVGAVFTFASFLKAGHSVFFGKRSEERAPGKVKESPWTMLVPILILALLCITFGVFNKLPLTQFIQPIIAGHAEAGAHVDFSAHALNLFSLIAGISVACLLLAFGIHVYGFKRGGNKAYLASEPIHRAPFFKQMYDWAEKRFFDIYEQGIKFLRGLSWVLFKGIDRPIDAVFEKGVTAVGWAFTGLLRKAHNGRYGNYLAWALGGLVVIIALVNVLMK